MKRESWLAVSGASALGQLALLAATSDYDVGRALVACTIPLAVSIGFAWRSRSPVWLAVALTAGLGGLGMMLGSIVDRVTGAVPACHAASMSALELSWMNGLMVLTCMPACAVACSSPRALQRSTLWLFRTMCAVAMFIGMWAGGRWLLPALTARLPPSAAHHLAMVCGMALGAGIAHSIVELVRARVETAAGGSTYQLAEDVAEDRGDDRD